MLSRVSCLGKISSCTSFHLSHFMNKFSSWNRYKRPFQIWGVFIVSWPFLFFLQISQVHVSARTRTSYPAQLVSILARGFFSSVLAECPEHFQFNFDFDLGNISDHFLDSYNCTVLSSIPHAILNSYWIQHFTKFSTHLHPIRLRNRWKAGHKQLYNIQSPIFWCDQHRFISSLTVSSHNIISATFQ